jgi:hypothetical protein
VPGEIELHLLAFRKHKAGSLQRSNALKERKHVLAYNKNAKFR